MKRKDDLTKIEQYIVIFAFAIALCCLTSCTIKKHVEKSKSETNTETSEQVKSSETGTNAVTTIAQRTITEEIAWPVILPADSSRVEVNIKDLITSGYFEEKDGDETITASIDNGKLKLKTKRDAKPLNLPVKKTTLENIASNSTSGFTANAEAKKDTKVQTKSESLKLDLKRSWWNWNYLWLLLILVAAILIWKNRHRIVTRIMGGGFSGGG